MSQDENFSIGQKIRKSNCHMLPFLASSKKVVFNFFCKKSLITCHKYYSVGKTIRHQTLIFVQNAISIDI